MKDKFTKKMEIEEIIIEKGVVYVHCLDSDFEADLNEVTNILEKELCTSVINDDYNFYQTINHSIWNDKYGNEESEFEEIKIGLSEVSSALLMSKSLRELTPVNLDLQNSISKLNTESNLLITTLQTL